MPVRGYFGGRLRRRYTAEIVTTRLWERRFALGDAGTAPPTPPTRTNLLGQISGTTGNFGTGNFITSSFTPPSNSLLVIGEAYIENNGTTTDPTSALTISGGGWTYTGRVSAVASPTSFPTAVKIWTAPVTTGASMTLTLGAGGRSASMYAVSVVAYTNYDTGTPTGGTASGSQSGGFTGPPDPVTILLSTGPAPGSEVFALVGVDKSVAGTTPGINWTEIDDLENTDSGGLESEFLTGWATDQVTWVDIRAGGGALFNFAAVGLEIRAGTGGATTSAPADVASGTGSTGDPGVAIAVNAENPAGTGSAGDAATAVAVNAECATGTGAALDAGPAVAVNADVASGTGTALDATTTSGGAATNAPAEVATGTGVAYDAGIQLAVNAEAPAGTGTAPDQVAAIAVSTGSPVGTGTAPDAGPALAVNAESPSGTGTALDATVSTAVFTNASAEVAAGVGTAGDPTPSVAASAEAPAGTGVAGQSTVALALSAEVAAGTGAALALAVTASGNALAEVAAGTGSAGDPLADVRFTVGVATGTASAFDLAVTASGTALAELAGGLGTAYNPTVSVAAAYTPIAVGMDGGVVAAGSMDGGTTSGGLDSGVPLTVGVVE